MHEMNEIERAVADELRRDAGPLLPVDDRALFESVSAQGRPRWSVSFLRFASYLAAGVIVALFGGFLLVGVVTEPSGDGPVAPGGSTSPEGTPSALPTDAPINDDSALSESVSDPKETEVINLKTPLATALAVGMLATPAASTVAQADLAPTQFTGRTSLPQTVIEGSRAWIDGALRGHDRIVTSDWEASDERLSGTYTLTHGYNDYEKYEMMVAVGDVLVENDDGRWTGTGSYLGGSQVGATSTIILQGQDAYQGYTAYVIIDEQAEPPLLAGAIFAGEMPVVTSD